MYRMIVELRIAPEDFKHMYSGSVKSVTARATNGQTINFPINILRAFVTENGVSGRFEIVFDRNHKFQSIKKLS